MDQLRYKNRHRLITWLRDFDIIGVRLFANSLPKLLLPEPKGELVLETIHGFKLLIDPKNDRGVERSIYYTGTYEKGTLHVISGLLKPGDTFVDVGANIGIMSILAAGRVGAEGRVVAFEPNPETRRILEANVSMNDIVNLEVKQFAVGASASIGVIFDHSDPNRGRATMVKPDQNGVGHEVVVVALDEQFKGSERVDMIKLDIEGYELEALKGMTALLKRSEPPMLIIEYSELRENSFGRKPTPIYDLLNAAGVYRFFRTAKSKERVSHLVEVQGPAEFPAHDNMYCLTARHVRMAQENALF